MGLRNWAVRASTPRAETRATTGLANPAAWLEDSLGTGQTFAGQRVTVQSMLQEAGVYSAVRMISEAIGLCPLKTYRIIPDSDERQEARTHRSWRMLHDAPNSVCTAHEFWAAVAVHLLSYENALIAKERGEPDQFGVSFVDQLWLLDPAGYRVMVTPDGRKVFENTESRQRYTQEQILHIPGFSTGGYVGRSRAEMCRQTLGTTIARSKFEGTYWRNGARIPGVIQHPGRLGDAGTRALAEGMGKWHSGVDNMHKFPVLEEGATMNWGGMTLESMQFVELRQQTMTEIAVMFQIPPAYLGASTGDSLTYATTESNQIQFAQNAIAPLANRIQSAISNDPDILPLNVMFAEFRLEALYRADMKTRAEYWSTMKQVLNLDPEYIASRENIPHTALKEPPDPAPPVPPAVGQLNGAESPPASVPPALAAAANGNGTPRGGS